MTAPPGHAPTTTDQPAVCNKQDAVLALLIRDARALDPALREVGKAKLLRMAREFVAAREADIKAPLPKSAQMTYSLSFLAWLMEQTPDATLGVRNRKAARQGRDYRPRDVRGQLVAS
jgi:hypothetical protein